MRMVVTLGLKWVTMEQWARPPIGGQAGPADISSGPTVCFDVVDGGAQAETGEWAGTARAAARFFVGTIAGPITTGIGSMGGRFDHDE